MKAKLNNNSNETPVISMAVRVINPGNEMSSNLVERFQTAMFNNGMCIYNGDDETEIVPFEALLRSIYYSCDPKDDEFEGLFEGWNDAAKITVVYFDACKPEEQQQLLENHFASSTVEMWCDMRKKYNGADTIAIHVDMLDGTWIENIINKTK